MSFRGPEMARLFDWQIAPVYGSFNGLGRNLSCARGGRCRPTKLSKERTGIMEVTTLAIEKLREVMEEQGEQEGALRVIAIPAETGGLQYMLTMENESQSDDTELNLEGVRFLMDSDSAPFLEEATIDYVENFGGQVGFVINNPMFAQAGGCGAGCGCGAGGGGCGCGAGGCGSH